MDSDNSPANKQEESKLPVESNEHSQKTVSEGDEEYYDEEDENKIEEVGAPEIQEAIKDSPDEESMNNSQ